MNNMDSDTTDLACAWQDLLSRHTCSAHVTEVGQALLAEWSRPHRHYHKLDHLRDVLGHIDELAHHATEPDLVRLAGWYHDAVYNCRPDDEDNSARRAERDLHVLGLEATSICEVARLIRLTASHAPAGGDRNGETLCDADLAILGADPDRYNSYAEAVRAEYAHYPDNEFRRGRAQLLKALLAAPTLFNTPLGRRYWDAAARTNLATELCKICDRNSDDEFI